jgi:hypothetical protein
VSFVVPPEAYAHFMGRYAEPLAAVFAASAVLGRDLARDIRTGTVLADRAALPELTPDWDPLIEAGGPENQRWTPELSVEPDSNDDEALAAAR